MVAKYWLQSVELASNHGFRAPELTRLRELVIEHQLMFLEAWNGYFGR